MFSLGSCRLPPASVLVESLRLAHDFLSGCFQCDLAWCSYLCTIVSQYLRPDRSSKSVRVIAESESSTPISVDEQISVARKLSELERIPSFEGPRSRDAPVVLNYDGCRFSAGRT